MSMVEQIEQTQHAQQTPPVVQPLRGSKVLTLEEVAERIGVGYETARRWALLNRIPVFKFNGRGHWRAYESDVDEYIAKHKNEAASWKG